MKKIKSKKRKSRSKKRANKTQLKLFNVNNKVNAPVKIVVQDYEEVEMSVSERLRSIISSDRESLRKCS